MRFVITLLFFTTFGFISKAQVATPAVSTHFFAQCLVQLTNETDYAELEQQLRQIPYVEVARVDKLSHRVFVLTKDLTTFNEQQFQSWLGVYVSNATCFQVGLHGIDPINPYPFTNCSN